MPLLESDIPIEKNGSESWDSCVVRKLVVREKIFVNQTVRTAHEMQLCTFKSRKWTGQKN